ncbi:Crp/Fnr family transcriptional regulator [Candidatus Saccharibacteria bacterium]|nr:Crp/Fnr family transcriptional regulator [Candidatus Saccharibacteria bacterium]
MDTAVTAKVNDFFGQFPTRDYKKGQILIHAGDDPDGVHYLTSGRVKMYDLTYRGDEVVLNIFKTGAFFPMSYVINRTPNLYFFEAEDNIMLHKAPVEQVLDFIKANPDVLFNLLARVYSGTDGVLQRMAHLMASSAKSRVIYELIIECRRFGEPSGDGFVMNLTESDIAARSGLSRETVSREMVKLRASGIIELNNKILLVPNLTELETTLGRDL